MIPLVVASERGLAQTTHVTAMCGVVGPRSRKTVSEKKRLWKVVTIDGDSPVFEANRSVVVS